MKKFFKAFGIAVGFIAIFLGIQALVSGIGTTLLSSQLLAQGGIELLDDPEQFSETMMEHILPHVNLFTIISNGITVAVVVIIILCRKKNPAQELHLTKTKPGNLIAAFFYSFGIMTAIDLFMSLLPIPQELIDEMDMLNRMTDTGNLALDLLSVAVFAPVTEEIIFRAMGYSKMKKGMHPLAAGFLSALLFGLCHGQSVWILFAFLGGVSLTWVYHITGSLWCSIIVHAVNNAVSVLYNNFLIPEDTVITYIVGGVCLVASILYLVHANRRTKSEVPVPAAD